VQPLLWNAADLAQALNVGEATIWRWASAGKLPASIKLGGARRWRREEIERWVAACCPARREWEALTAARGGGAR
jgi:excisionase family DNA binding protein